MNEDRPRPIPLPTIRRYPEYLIVLEAWREQGCLWISATDFGKELDRKPIVVRKDLGYSGITGHSRKGYDIEELIRALRQSLGWDNSSDAFLVGVGSLGRALLSYGGFTRYGLKIAAAFDKNPRLVGRVIAGRDIMGLDKLPDLATRMDVNMGILAVPAEAAQATADLLVDAGIRGLWNFAPVNLKVPPDVVVKREDLSLGLAILSYRLKGLDDEQWSDDSDPGDR